MCVSLNKKSCVFKKKKKHGHLPNYRTYKHAEAVLCINLGQVAAAGVAMKPTKACKSWSQLEKAPRHVFIFNVTVLLEGWRK